MYIYLYLYNRIFFQYLMNACFSKVWWSVCVIHRLSARYVFTAVSSKSLNISRISKTFFTNLSYIFSRIFHTFFTDFSYLFHGFIIHIFHGFIILFSSIFFVFNNFQNMKEIYRETKPLLQQIKC